MISTLHPRRLEHVKKSFVTRRVPLEALKGIDRNPEHLRAGDVVIAGVEKIGQHQRLELPTGRRASLKVGEEIIVACGARYAPDQFHALVPESTGDANLVAAGGIAGLETDRHSRMKEATSVAIVGRFVDQNREAVNLAGFALPDYPTRSEVPVILVAGTSMNSGKTATCTAVIQGFKTSGLRTAYVKATGTGSGGDIWAARDAGAAVALDFTDAGYASTYLVDPEHLVETALLLIEAASDAACDAIVVEIADGILQQETSALLRSPRILGRATATVLAAADSIGAMAAYAWLNDAGHRVAATTGAFTQAPLAMLEFSHATGQQSVRLSDLRNSPIIPVPRSGIEIFGENATMTAVA